MVGHLIRVKPLERCRAQVSTKYMLTLAAAAAAAAAVGASPGPLRRSSVDRWTSF